MANTETPTMLLLRFAVHIQFRIVAIVVLELSRDPKPTIHILQLGISTS